MFELSVPGDKSISHRALMLAPLATGHSRVSGLLVGADVMSTGQAMRTLGVPYDPARLREGRLDLEGPCELRSPRGTIDCGNSGTTARILLGLLAGRPITATMSGDASLRRRPMGRVIRPLRAAGARIRELGEAGRLPLEIRGGQLKPIEHESAVASAQVKSSLLLAGLGSGVPVCVNEPGASRDHTERMLRTMGAHVTTEEFAGGVRRVCLSAHEGTLAPLEFRVPGDFSSAAFFVVLALLGGAGEGIRIDGVGLNPGRTGLLRVLERMGADLDVRVGGDAAGEPTGSIVARPSQLHGAAIPAEWMPTLLDEIPVLVCAAARARGRTTVRGAAELRVKESDRLTTLAANLIGLGVTVHELDDGLVVDGTDAPLRGAIATEGDHRIAMAFGVLGALPGVEIGIDDPDCVTISYPDFWADLDRATVAGGS